MYLTHPNLGAIDGMNAEALEAKANAEMIFMIAYRGVTEYNEISMVKDGMHAVIAQIHRYKTVTGEREVTAMSDMCGAFLEDLGNVTEIYNVTFNLLDNLKINSKSETRNQIINFSTLTKFLTDVLPICKCVVVSTQDIVRLSVVVKFFLIAVQCHN